MYNAMMQLLTSFIGALGFALLFNVRKALLPAAAFGGMMVWGVYLGAEWAFGGSVFLASVCAAAVASIYAEAMARVEKAPATVFYIPALIPLVPGGSLYYAMSYAVRSDWDMVSRYGSATFYCALGIACGMSIVLAMEYTINKLAAQRKP